MTNASLEHINITVSEPTKTADMLCNIFGWKVRWSGDAIHGGISIHVGTDDDYIAVYSGKNPTTPKDVNYDIIGGLNHIALVVDDLDKVEERVLEEGFEPFSHADYEPGRRFYFHDADGIQYEVVCYT